MRFRITTRDQRGVEDPPLIADEDDDSISVLYDIAAAFYSAGTAFDLPVGGTIEIERIA